MTGTTEPPVVRLRDVAKTYRAGAVEVKAVKGVSLDIPPQRFSMIVGPSGSGKTTLLNLIGCIDTPSAGSVEIDGQDAAALSDEALPARAFARAAWPRQRHSPVIAHRYDLSRPWCPVKACGAVSVASLRPAPTPHLIP